MNAELMNLPEIIAPAKASEVQARGRWRKGQSGNPEGRKSGTGNPFIKLVRKKSEERKEELVQAWLEGVKNCEPIPLKLWVERFLPLRRYIELPDLPEIVTAQDLKEAFNVTMQAARTGNLDMESAETMTRLLAAAGNALSYADLEKRLLKLEQGKS